MTVLTQHRFSVEDYYRMAETGVLKPDARVELLDGQINDMSPIGPYHSSVVKRLSRLFHLKSAGRWIVSTQDPIHLGEYSEPEPDIALVKSVPDDYAKQHPQADDIFLLIEVADASLFYDRDAKLPLYGRAGIAEVWIVNLVQGEVEVYRDPSFTGYETKTNLRTGRIAPHLFPDVEVDVVELLKH